MKLLFKITLCLVAFAALFSCARMGRPTGGERDVLPPLYIKSSPAMGATNVKSDKIEIEFDELIQLKDQTDKVVISPAQTQQATIRSNGKKVTVEFKDSLIPDCTYTIDFSDAVVDYTESNALENFSLYFSTGSECDSLRISGVLLDSKTLEPQQKMLVGVYSNLDDSTFTTLPLERMARTNESGQFIVRNLKPGKYRLFAVNDVDRNNRFTVGEDIAFYPTIIEPTCENIVARDTIYNELNELDTIVEVTRVKYMPNDILLSMFNENRSTQYLVNDERLDSMKLYLQFATKADTLPEIRLIDYPEKTDWYRIDRSLTNDTITYWLTDRELISADTIRAELQYLKTDTAQQLSAYTDTILFKLKRGPVKKEKEKKKKKDEESDSLEVSRPDPAKFNITSSIPQNINMPLRFKSQVPLDTIVQSAVHLQIKADTLWNDITPPPLIVRDNEYNPFIFHADYAWEPGATYKLMIDSAAIVDIYGLVSDPLVHEFSVRTLDEYSDLILHVNVGDSAFVELMATDNKPQYTAKVENGDAVFNYINPGTYYARIIIDRNGNGQYDTGLYSELIQPEDVYYFPKKLNLRRNWEVEETWDIYAKAVDAQKPEEIKKNKPTKKSWERDVKKDRNGREIEEDEYEEEDETFDVNRNPFAPASSRKNATTHY